MFLLKFLVLHRTIRIDETHQVSQVAGLYHPTIGVPRVVSEALAIHLTNLVYQAHIFRVVGSMAFLYALFY